MRGALAWLSLLLATAGTCGEVHKCRMADGSVAFLDHECPAAAQTLDAPKLASELPFAWHCGKDEPVLQDQAELSRMPPIQDAAFRSVLPGFAYGHKDVRMSFDRARNLHLCSSTSRGPSETVVTVDGRIWMNREGRVKRLNAYDRLSRLAACSKHITSCFEPGVRGLEQCTVAAPICTTSEPVEGEPACCEAACIARFRELRAQDVDPMSALQRALYDNEACAGVAPDPSRRK